MRIVVSDSTCLNTKPQIIICRNSKWLRITRVLTLQFVAQCLYNST